MRWYEAVKKPLNQAADAARTIVHSFVEIFDLEHMKCVDVRYQFIVSALISEKRFTHHLHLCHYQMDLDFERPM
jgi:hypothetical protein